MKSYIVSFRPILSIAGLLLVVMGCTQERKGGEASSNADSTQVNEDATKKRIATVQFSQLQQKEFLAQMETAKSRMAKLGNKTRKKLKPTMDDLEVKRGSLAELIDSLPNLEEPHFQATAARIDAIVDSANAKLAEFKKHLK